MKVQISDFFFKPYPFSHPHLIAIGWEIGLRFRLLRKARGQSASKVAARLGITPAYLYQLERGQRDLNSFQVFRWASILCVNANELGDLLELWGRYNELEDSLIRDVTKRIRGLAGLSFSAEELDEACYLSSWLDPRERAQWPAIRDTLVRLAASR